MSTVAHDVHRAANAALSFVYTLFKTYIQPCYGWPRASPRWQSVFRWYRSAVDRSSSFVSTDRKWYLGESRFPFASIFSIFFRKSRFTGCFVVSRVVFSFFVDLIFEIRIGELSKMCSSDMYINFSLYISFESENIRISKVKRKKRYKRSYLNLI